MFDLSTETSKSVLDTSAQISIRPIAQYLENDVRGIGLKEVHARLDSLSSRIAKEIESARDPDENIKLQALQKSSMSARDIATIVWRSIHD